MKKFLRRTGVLTLCLTLIFNVFVFDAYASNGDVSENSVTAPVKENGDEAPLSEEGAIPEDAELVSDTGYVVFEEVPEGYEDDVILPEADPSEESVYQTIIALKSQFPEGMHYTNADMYMGLGIIYNRPGYPNGVRMRGYGCAGFALRLSDEVWGSQPLYEVNDMASLKVGDIVRVSSASGGHSFVILENYEDRFIIAEANYNSSVHWGRTILKSELRNTYEYHWTRYTEGIAPIIKKYNPPNRTKITAFVRRMYNIVLERNAESKGLSSWVSALYNSQADGSDVAKGFVLSPEYVNKNTTDEQFVDTMYLAFMDREADAGGKANWVNVLKRGYSREYVAAGFINSQEFTNICDTYGIKRGTLTADDTRSDSNLYVDYDKVCAYVDSLYKNILKRNADQAGKDDWVYRIRTHQMGAAEVARIGFFTSTEYLNKNTSNEQFLTDIYAAFFNRQPDSAGYNYWLARMAEGYTRDQVILEGFGQSQEFNNLLRSYGLKSLD